jgi:hypothetical protein
VKVSSLSPELWASLRKGVLLSLSLGWVGAEVCLQFSSSLFTFRRQRLAFASGNGGQLRGEVRLISHKA